MQSKTMSMIETIINYTTGFIIAMAVTYWVLPFWGFQPSPQGAAEITLLYTVISIIRSYTFRRLFNWIHHRSSDRFRYVDMDNRHHEDFNHG